MAILLFNRWDMDAVKVEDPGLKEYINVAPVIVPRSCGRLGTVQIHKNKINVVERFMSKLMVPGHRGKKHKRTSGKCPASLNAIQLSVIRAFEDIEKKTSQNPVQVMVKAIENCAVLEEVASYRLGGIIARQSVVSSPQRRLDLALRFLSQGIFHGGASKKVSLSQMISDELISASKNDPKSVAVREKSRIEKEAEGAR